MLDHAGDTLYRLGWKEKAIEAWKLSAEGLKNDTSLSSDDRELKPLLEEKLKAIKDGKDPQLAKTIAELQVEKKTSPSSSPTSEPANKNESDIEVPASSSEDDE